ncbi:MAG: hypothetical protein NUW02_02490 [Candidatus Campbellbacteria bacterium]|nr:hypothetical protein [Candidatus Campbellbacteria bacterium]
MYIQELLYTADIHLIVKVALISLSVMIGCLIGWHSTRTKRNIQNIPTKNAEVFTSTENSTVHSREGVISVTVSTTDTIKKTGKLPKKIIVS